MTTTYQVVQIKSSSPQTNTNAGQIEAGRQWGPKPKKERNILSEFCCCDVKYKVIVISIMELIFGVCILIIHILSLMDAQSAVKNQKGKGLSKNEPNDMVLFDYSNSSSSELDQIKVYSGTTIGLICLYLILSLVLLLGALKESKFLTQTWMILSCILYITYVTILGLYHPTMPAGFIVILLLFFVFKLYEYIVVGLLLFEEVAEPPVRSKVTTIIAVKSEGARKGQRQTYIVETDGQNSRADTGGQGQGKEGQVTTMVINHQVHYPHNHVHGTHGPYGYPGYSPYYPYGNRRGSDFGEAGYPTVITIKKFVRKISEDDDENGSEIDETKDPKVDEEGQEGQIPGEEPSKVKLEKTEPLEPKIDENPQDSQVPGKKDEKTGNGEKLVKNPAGNKETRKKPPKEPKPKKEKPPKEPKNPKIKDQKEKK